MGAPYFTQLFNLGGTAVTALTAMNPGTTAAAGAFSVPAKGALQKIYINVTPQAASSLAQNGYVQLVCTTWSPVNTLILSFNGFGLATAPQLYGGAQAANIFPPVGDGFLNLPVDTAVAINGSVIYFFSPVTPNITVCGLFTTS